MNVLDCFAGTGSFSLGFERAGMRTRAFIEADRDCVSVLRRHWPNVPVFGDVRTFRTDAGYFDIAVGGFPCQPFSTAARGRNNATDLWPHFLRIVQDAQPTWVVAENVLGIGDAGADRVSSDLEDAGYEVWPFDLDTALPARQRGRHRIIWLAHTNRQGQPRRTQHGEMAGIRAIPPGSATHDARPLGMDDGTPYRMDRLHMLGNAVTANAAELIGHVIVRTTLSGAGGQ